MLYTITKHGNKDITWNTFFQQWAFRSIPEYYIGAKEAKAPLKLVPEKYRNDCVLAKYRRFRQMPFMQPVYDDPEMKAFDKLVRKHLG